VAGTLQDPWQAPSRARRLDAVVELPGSKSLTARYLVLAALARGPSTLRNALLARDTRLMIQALTSLGADVRVKISSGAGTRCTSVVDVTPGPIHGNTRVDCGLAGTVMRFLPPVAALASTPVTFDGDEAARRRPLAPLIDALADLGVRIDNPGDGFLPLTVRGTGAVKGGDLAVDASASSQFASGLLLAAPRFTRGLTLTNSGATLPSAPHLAMTLAALRAFGATAHDDGPHPPFRWTVSGSLTGQDITIEPDLSNAGPFLAAALVAGGRVRIPDWPEETTQAGDLLRHYLAAFGATVSHDLGILTVEADPDSLHGADLDLHPAGELVPTLAAIALFADSPTTLRGIAHLRGHETDRLAAIVAETTALGGCARADEDSLVIEPRPLQPAVLDSHGDHRMATFAAIVGLRVAGVGIRNVAATAKTIPDFPARWARFLGGTS